MRLERCVAVPLLAVLLAWAAGGPSLSADGPADPERDAAEAREFVAALRAVVERRDGVGLLALQSASARAGTCEGLRPVYEKARTDPQAGAEVRKALGSDVDLAALSLEEFSGRLMGLALRDRETRETLLEPIGLEVLDARREGDRLYVHARSRPTSWFRRRDGTHEFLLVRSESRWTIDGAENGRHLSRLVERVAVEAPADLAGILPDGSTLVVGPALTGRSRLALVPFRRPGAVVPWDYDGEIVRLVAVHPDGKQLLAVFETLDDEVAEEYGTPYVVSSVDTREGRRRHVLEGPAAVLAGSPKGGDALLVQPQSRSVLLCSRLGCSKVWTSEWADVTTATWLAGGEVVALREEQGDVIVAWPGGRDKHVAIRHRGGPADALAAHPTEPWLAVPHAEAGAVLYDARDGRPLRRLGDLPGVQFLSFSPDGNQLLLVRGARALRVGVRDGARLGEHRGASDFHGIFWHPRLPLLLAGVREAGDKPSIWAFSTAE